MYLVFIDGLRAIAVLSVIVNHIDKDYLPYGYLGVDMFYVISGYVITQSLLSRTNSASFGRFALQFFTRRVKRLFPALVACVGITLLCIFLVVPHSYELVAYTRTGIASLFGLSNFYLFRLSSDYFGAAAILNPFTHTWSLGVEEQFYFIFPFILWLSCAGKKDSGHRLFYTVLCVAAIISLIAYISVSQINDIAAFYLMPFRFWEIAVGAIAYLALSRNGEQETRNKKQRKHYSLLADIIACAALLLLTSLFFRDTYELSQVSATILVVIMTCILIVGVRPGGYIYKLLSQKWLVFVGIISYSLYLWHWSVLAISRHTVGVNEQTIPYILVVIFFLAWLSFKFVEQPLRNAEWNFRWKSGQGTEIRYAALCSVALSLLVILMITPLSKNGGIYTGELAALEKKGVATLKENQTYQQHEWIVENCILSSNFDVGKHIRYTDCTFGDHQTAVRHYLVVGNSFSVAQIEMYKVLVEEQHSAVTITSSWGASPVPNVENTSPWNEANQYYWNTVIPSLIDQLSRGDVILMVNDGAEFSPKHKNKHSLSLLANLEEGLSNFATEMSIRGISVVYQSGLPFLRESECTPDQAVRQWWSIGEPCKYYSREASLARRREYHQLLVRLQQQHENFAVLDLFNVFCPDDICKYYDHSGVFLYRDEWSHPSVEASLMAQPMLQNLIEKNFPLETAGMSSW